MELNEILTKRLTDDNTYKECKEAAEGLTRAGRLPAYDLLRYIKLAEYEQVEELFISLSPHLEKWQLIAVRYAMAEHIQSYKTENRK